MTNVPEKLADGLAIVVHERGILLEGSPRRLHLGGKTAVSVMPKLLSLLDGTVDSIFLCETLEISSDQLEQILDLLRKNGLLDQSPSLKVETITGSAPTHTYFSRMHMLTSAYAGSAEILTELAAAEVVLVGDCAILAAMAADLESTGIGTVVLANRPEDIITDNIMTRPGRRVVVVLDEPGSDIVNRTVAAHGNLHSPVLRIFYNSRHVAIGPVFVRETARACPVCLHRSLADTDWGSADDSSPSVGGRGLMIAAASREVVALISSVERPSAEHVLTHFDLNNLRTTSWALTPYADCMMCGFTIGGAGAEASIPETFEWMMRARSESAKASLSSAEISAIKLIASNRPEYATEPRTLLPKASAPIIAGVIGDAPTSIGSVDLASISMLLRQTVGRQNPDDPLDAKRWTASGGNFGSVGGYVVAPGIGSWPGSCLRYDDVTDELIHVHTDNVTPHQSLLGTDLAGSTADFVIILVSDVGRLAGKYRNFAWRLSHLDAGCAALQLAIVARGLGFQITFAATWNEQPADLLELDRDAEIVTVIAALRSSGKEIVPCP